MRLAAGYFLVGWLGSVAQATLVRFIAMVESEQGNAKNVLTRALQSMPHLIDRLNQHDIAKRWNIELSLNVYSNPNRPDKAVSQLLTDILTPSNIPMAGLLSDCTTVTNMAMQLTARSFNVSLVDS
jgi:hypothetical protein